MEKININLMNEFKYLSNLNPNKSKNMFTYTVRKANVKENKYNSSLYLYKDNKNICLIENDNSTFSGWYDDNSIILKRNEKDDDIHTSTFFKLTLGEGEAKKIFKIPLAVADIKKIDEDNFLVLATINVNYENLHSMTKEKREEILKNEKDYSFKVEIKEIPFWENGGTYTNDERQHLFIFNSKTNEIKDILDDKYMSVSSFDLDFIEKKIVYIATRFENKLSLYNGIYEYDINSGKTKEVYPEKDYSFSVVSYTKDNIFTLATDMKKYGINQDVKPYWINRKSNDLSIIFHDEVCFGNSVGSDARMGFNKFYDIEYDTNILTFIATVENKAVLMKYDNNLSTIVDNNGSVDGFVTVNDSLYTLEFRDNMLAEIYKENEKITSFNDDIFKDMYTGTPNRIVFNSNGADIVGYVILPENFDKNKKYKAILDVHGGPKTVYGSIYYHEMQVWANLGYVVMFTNPHGSDGREDEYSDIRGKYGSIDYTDLMNFVDVVLKKYPNIDENRLGVTGGSYGGFMTNWIITHTNKFKCAATQRSISNWISMYGVSDIGYYFSDDQNNTKFEKEDFFKTLWEFSPLKYIKNCTTPTLIIHADSDYRCPVDQGYQLLTALKDMNIPSKMVVYKNENHELSRSGKPLARISRLENITNWMEEYLN